MNWEGGEGRNGGEGREGGEGGGGKEGREGGGWREGGREGGSMDRRNKEVTERMTDILDGNIIRGI